MTQDPSDFLERRSSHHSKVDILVTSTRNVKMNTHSSYYDRKQRQGPALQRARRPYIVKNAFTGLGLLLFAAGVYSYTLNAVGQDDFTDVKVPEKPRNAPAKTQ